MIAVFLIVAGVCLVAGAGFGTVVAALVANARVEAARADAARADMRAELDALSIAGPDIAAGLRTDLDGMPVDVLTPDHPAPSWAAAGLDSAAAEPPSFDANPTVLLGPGQTYEQWYADYAEHLDQLRPRWWEHLAGTVAPELARLADERRRETYEQRELDQDRVPTREGLADCTHGGDCQVHPTANGLHNFDAERPWRPNRPGMAIYPGASTSDGGAR